MNIAFYGHVRQYHNIQNEIDTNIQEVLESGQYVMGPMLKRFEKEFAAYHGMSYAVGVGNGTDALWLAFQALGIGPGDECERNAACCISLPMFPELTEQEADYVIGKVLEWNRNVGVA